MTETIYDWTETRARATTLYGEPPGAALEMTIVNHFTNEPAKVIDLIERIGKRIHDGEPIHSGWALTRHELEKPRPTVTVTDGYERTKAVDRAVLWIKNAGGYVPTETELINELYDESRGPLRHWPDTKEHIIETWRNQQARFAKAEADALIGSKTEARATARLIDEHPENVHGITTEGEREAEAA